MANYDALMRSNYFRVKDEEAFDQFCSDHYLTKIEETKDGVRLFGFYNDDGTGYPTCHKPEYDENGDEIDESTDCSFFEELVPHLVEDSVAVIMEIGNEKMRYLNGFAWAINSKGDIQSVSLNDIYDKAALLGDQCTIAEF